MTEPTLFDQFDEVIKTFDKSLISRFHNTTSLQGDDLKEHQFKAGKLNRRVLDFFISHSYENYTPFEVWKALGVNSCIRSSVQRSMTDLTEMTYLEKLDGKERPDGTKKPFVQRPGQYNSPSFAWRLK